MKSSLVNLVASLSPSEKRYFKKQFNGTRAEKQYLRLFDFIADDPENYSDEQAAKKLGVRQIRVLKFRLQEHLLVSLSRNFAHSEEYQRPDPNQVKVLRSKRLFDDALSLLGKQLKIAKEAEDFHLVLQLLDIRENLLRARQERAFNTTLLLSLCKEKEEYLRLLDHVHQLEKLRNLLIQVRVDHTPDRKGKIPVLSAKYLHAYKSYLDPEKMTTISQKCLYHEISFIRYDSEKKIQKSIEHSLKRIEFHQLPVKPAMLTVGSYAATLNNHIVLLFKNNLLRETVPFINLFRALKSPDLNLQTHIFYSSNVAYTNYLIGCETVTCTEAMLKAIEDQYNGIYSRRHEKEMTLKYNIAVLHFRLRNYKKARSIFFMLLTDPAQQKHIGFYANVMFLLTLFELKEIDVFEKEAAAFINAQKKKGQDFLFEITLLGFLEELLSQNHSPKATRRALHVFYETKAAAMLKGKYRQAMDYFDFEKYLQGRF